MECTPIERPSWSNPRGATIVERHLPFCAAMNAGVLPAVVVARLMSAEASSSAVMHSTCPPCAASKSAVAPWSLCARSTSSTSNGNDGGAVAGAVDVDNDSGGCGGGGGGAVDCNYWSPFRFWPPAPARRFLNRRKRRLRCGDRSNDV